MFTFINDHDHFSISDILKLFIPLNHQQTTHGGSCCQQAKAKDGGNVLEMASWLSIFKVGNCGLVWMDEAFLVNQTAVWEVV